MSSTITSSTAAMSHTSTAGEAEDRFPTIIDVDAIPAGSNENNPEVQTIFDDLSRRFPHEEGEGRFPVPGDWRNQNGEWNDTLFKVVGFIACYSDTDDADCIEMGEPFMEADFLRDSTGAAIIVYQRENAEALRRYADEMIGLPLMTVSNPFGSGYLFLYMDPASPLTVHGHTLFEKLAAYLNYRNQPWTAGMIATLASPNKCGYAATFIKN